MINDYVEPSTPFKLETGKKPSILYLRVLFFTCVVRKATAHVGKKTLNIRHQAQKFFCVIFVEITKHQKGYISYVPHKRNIVSS